MNILQVSHTDIPGQKFDGFDLMNALANYGINCKMLVKNKRSANPNVIDITESCKKSALPQIDALSNCYRMDNMLSPWVDMIVASEAWRQADIVHYHLLRAFPISVSNMSKLFDGKKTVLTMHDFWPVTGGCIHTLGCEKWKNGCRNCEKSDIESHEPFPLASYQYACKRKCFENQDVEIVVTCNYMYGKVLESGFFPEKKMHIIPFGLQEQEEQNQSDTFREQYKIDKDTIIVGFRTQSAYMKGLRYVYEALDGISDTHKIFLIGVGGEDIPEQIAVRFRHVNLKWLDNEGLEEFYGVCDIFLMPSLAESFGLMAIEAMRRGCAVICFEGTALEEVTGAPDCGVAVTYKSSEGLRVALTELVNAPDRIREIGEKSKAYVCEKYRFEEYVRKHIALYNRRMEG